MLIKNEIYAKPAVKGLMDRTNRSHQSLTHWALNVINFQLGLAKRSCNIKNGSAPLTYNYALSK